MIDRAILLVTLSAASMATECSVKQGEFLDWEDSGVKKREEFLEVFVRKCTELTNNRPRHPLGYSCHCENKAKQKQRGTDATDGHYGYMEYLSYFVPKHTTIPEYIALELWDKCRNKPGLCENVNDAKGMGCSRADNVSFGFNWYVCMIDPNRHSGGKQGYANMCEPKK